MCVFQQILLKDLVHYQYNINIQREKCVPNELV